MDGFNDFFMENRPYKCEKCEGKMLYIGSGAYRCKNCGYTALDVYGKVKAFLDEYGTQPALVISDATGVPLKILNELLKEGRLQLPAGSKIFLKCEKCGCALRSGRYCRECALETFRGIEGLLIEDAGERVKNSKENEPGEVPGRIRFMGKRKK